MKTHGLEFALACLVVTLSGCATYEVKPLATAASLSRSAVDLRVEPTELPFHRLASHPFNPDDGFDMDEVAMLAVANNPQLRQARDRLDIARAQSFAAGLLPDPQLGFSTDHPTNGTAGNTTAFNVNASYDVNALLLRSSRVAAASGDEQRVSLELLWQEWQVVSQARLLFARLTSQRRLLAQLEEVRDLLAARSQRGQQALAAGNLTVAAVSADLTALQSVERQINELQRTELQDHARLNGLLGLAPGVSLELTGETTLPSIDPLQVRAGLATRLAQRPDLRALRAGYQSQEERFRGAVLAQFPALNIGLTRARDTSGLYTLGFGLSLSLPIFNASRGNIAIERATRKLLFDEYQDRLDRGYAEIDTALANLPLLQAQLQRSRAGLAETEVVVRRAEAAYRAGNMTAPDYVRLRQAVLARHIEVLNLQEALMEQKIALEALLGPGLPTADGGRQP